MGPGREGSEMVALADREDDHMRMARTTYAYALLGTYLDGLDRYTSFDPRVLLGAVPHPDSDTEEVRVIDLRVATARSVYGSLGRQDPTVGDVIDLGL